jgi:hypothetical protein
MKLTFYDECGQLWTIDLIVEICDHCAGTAEHPHGRKGECCPYCYKGIAPKWENSWKDVEPHQREEARDVIDQRYRLYRKLGTWNMPKTIGKMEMP